MFNTILIDVENKKIQKILATDNEDIYHHLNCRMFELITDKGKSSYLALDGVLMDTHEEKIDFNVLCNELNSLYDNNAESIDESIVEKQIKELAATIQESDNHTIIEFTPPVEKETEQSEPVQLTLFA